MREPGPRLAPWLLLVLSATAGLPPARAAEPEPGSASLAPAARAPAAPRRTISDLLREELDTLKEAEQARVEQRRVTTGRRGVRGELERLALATVDLQRRLTGLRRDLTTRRDTTRARVRLLYRKVRATSRYPLLDPRRAHAPRDGRESLVRIVRRDLTEVRRLRGEEQRLVVALEDLKLRRRQALAVVRDLDRRRDEVQASVNRLQQALVDVRYRRTHHRGHMAEWTAQAYAMEKDIVARTLRLRQATPSFESRRGSLVRPVAGMIVQTFGEEPVAGTRTTAPARGIEISALASWKVRAPAPGTVRFAGPVEGFGNVLVIDHDEGYLSVIGRLGEVLVKPGDTVPVAAPVALLSGRAQERLAVYYELRLEGKAVDPIPWLQGGLAEVRDRGLGTPRPRPGPPAAAGARTRVIVKAPAPPAGTTAERDP
jgi:hypothetical protein